MRHMFLAMVMLGVTSGHAEIISAGVAMVRGQAVTSRDVQIQHLLEKALFGDKNSDPKDKLPSLDSKAFAKAVHETLLESVVALEAQNFNVVQVSPEEIRQAEKKVARELKGSRAWVSLRASPKELEGAIRRKLQAKKFVQFRAQSSVLPVTDVEAQRYFNENRLKFGNLPFENFKENIKSYLSRAQVERRLQDWYDILLSKYQVKNLIAEI